MLRLRADEAKTAVFTSLIACRNKASNLQIGQSDECVQSLRLMNMINAMKLLHVQHLHQFHHIDRVRSICRLVGCKEVLRVILFVSKSI